MKTPEELAEDYDYDRFDDEAEIAKKAFLAGYAAANRWIPVSEELPLVGEFCLVKLNIEHEPPIQFAKRLEDSTKVCFHTHRAIWCGLESITHWIPLPPQPSKDPS